MLQAGLGLVAVSVLCVWLFVSVSATADARHQHGQPRPVVAPLTVTARRWLRAAVVTNGLGVGLLLAHVAGLWL